MKNIGFVICYSVETPTPAHAHLMPSCTQESCDRCYRSVWISPSAQSLVASAPTRPEIVCLDCYRTSDIDAPFVLAPGQLAEIAQVAGPDFAMRVAKAHQPQPETN